MRANFNTSKKKICPKNQPSKTKLFIKRSKILYLNKVLSLGGESNIYHLPPSEHLIKLAEQRPMGKTGNSSLLLLYKSNNTKESKKPKIKNTKYILKNIFSQMLRNQILLTCCHEQR